MSKAGIEAFAAKAMADEAFRRKIKENPDPALAETPSASGGLGRGSSPSVD